MTPRTPEAVDEVPSFVLASVPAFKESPELERLDTELRSIAGLLVGQLTIFLRRLQADALKNPESSAEVRSTLRQVFDTVEAMASSSNADIENLVIVEVLEHLHATPNELEALLNGFGPATRGLYARWVDPWT